MQADATFKDLVDNLGNQTAAFTAESLDACLNALKEGVQQRLKSASPEDAQIFKLLNDGLIKIPAALLPAKQSDLIVDISQYFYLSGSPFEALSLISRAEQLALTSGDIKNVYRVANFQGILFADIGDSAKAIEKYSTALEMARFINEVLLEARVWLNLGVALTQSSEIETAIHCFNRVIELAVGQPNLASVRLAALNNISAACIRTEDYSRGLPYAMQSVEESVEPTKAAQMLSRVQRENNLARLLMEVHSMDAASEHVELAKHYSVLSRSPRADLDVSIIEGLFLVYSGNADLGLARLNQALEKARVLKFALRDVLMALVKANEIVGEHDKALVHMKEIVTDMRKAKEGGALQHMSMQTSMVKASHARDGSEARLQMHHDALEGKVVKQEMFKYQAEQKHLLKKQREEVDQARMEMLERMAVTAELRDDSTGEHSYRVGKMASLLAAMNGAPEDTLHTIDIAGRLHDIGKIGIPDAILLKPGKLNVGEREIMKSHPTIGAELLSKSHVHQVKVAEEIARYHHEWWDGTGYPEGLVGTAIPLSARIAALADVFDALTHKRPYKEAWPATEALREIMSLRGRQFDPKLTDMFVGLVASLLHEHDDLDAYLSTAAQASPFLQARKKIREALSRVENVHTSDSRLDMQR